MILKEKCGNSSKKQSKRLKKMANKDEKCPLCVDILEIDDVNFYPCTCGYQVCRFCWHRIRTNENGLCPACRRQYSEDPVTFKPLTQQELQKLKNEKKLKEIAKKKEIAESRKQLANIRVVQKNLVYVHGLPLGIETDNDKYRRLLHTFKDFGPVTKLVINNKTNYAGSQSHCASAYVTYQKIEDALKGFKMLPTMKIEGHDVKTSLGTTKYCSNFLKNVHCPKQDCMYLHEMAEGELSFTKEQIHSGEHIICGENLYQKMREHFRQKAAQNIQPKEPHITEQEVEIEKPSPKIVKLKEETYESSDDSSNSPIQSRLQHLFCNSEMQDSAFGVEFENHFNLQFDLQPPAEKVNCNGFDSEQQHVQQSLPSVESTVNSSHTPVNTSAHTIHSFPNFTTQSFQELHNRDLWPEQGSPVIGPVRDLHNHVHQNGLPNDYKPRNPTNSFIGGLVVYSNTRTSNSLPENNESENLDDDLGFDPCQISLKGLQDLLKSEARVHPNKMPSSHGDGGSLLKSTISDLQQQSPSQNQPQLQQLRNVQPFQRQQRNPPPGFPMNNFPCNQPLSSPVFESRNALQNRMSPHTYHVSNRSERPGFQLPRFQTSAAVSMNTNSLGGSFSPQPIRSLPPQTVHELLSRPAVNGMQSQRGDNLSQPQFNTVEPNLSPSCWNNTNQSYWMPAENCVQNQGISDFRPPSPLLNLRRMQQLRSNDFNRQVQQLTARYNNFSPFSDNPQYMFPNNQQNQLTKGVHTFP